MHYKCINSPSKYFTSSLPKKMCAHYSALTIFNSIDHHNIANSSLIILKRLGRQKIIINFTLINVWIAFVYGFPCESIRYQEILSIHCPCFSFKMLRASHGINRGSSFLCFGTFCGTKYELSNKRNHIKSHKSNVSPYLRHRKLDEKGTYVQPTR